MAFGIKYIPLSPGGCDFASRMNGSPAYYPHSPQTPVASSSSTRDYWRDLEKLEASRKQLSEIPSYSPVWDSPQEFLEELSHESVEESNFHLVHPFHFPTDSAEFLLDNASDVSMDSSEAFELPEELLADFNSEPVIFQEMPEGNEYIDFSVLDQTTLETFQKQFEEFDRMFPPPDVVDAVATPSESIPKASDDIEMGTTTEDQSSTSPSTSKSPSFVESSPAVSASEKVTS